MSYGILQCPEQDSNLHASQHSHLKRARLPFRHLGFFCFCVAKVQMFCQMTKHLTDFFISTLIFGQDGGWKSSSGRWDCRAVLRLHRCAMLFCLMSRLFLRCRFCFCRSCGLLLPLSEDVYGYTLLCRFSDIRCWLPDRSYVLSDRLIYRMCMYPYALSGLRSQI